MSKSKSEPKSASKSSAKAASAKTDAKAQSSAKTEPKPPPRKRGRPRIDTITTSQKRVLKGIEDCMHAHGYPPTIQELADELSITAPSVHGLIKQLERKGYLKRDSRKARGLNVVYSSEHPLLGLVEIPLVGMVAAGQPLMAQENVLGNILVDSRLIRSAPCFALRVTGNSMKDAQINAGDIVIVRQQPLAQHNDIVVAQIDGEATVKRLYLQDSVIELRPENTRYRPIRITPENDLRILGKVVAVQRPKNPPLD